MREKISLMRAVVLDTVPACDRHGRTDTGLAEHREGSKTDRGGGAENAEPENAGPSRNAASLCCV